MEFKNAAALAEALKDYAGEVRSTWRTNTGALTDAGCEYRRFLLEAAEKIESFGEWEISWRIYSDLCDGDEYDYTLRAWEEVPEA